MTKIEFMGNFNKKYNRLMSGEVVSFLESRVWELLKHLDYYRINTLMIQEDTKGSTDVTKWFICKVDQPTINAYLKEKNKEISPLG